MRAGGISSLKPPVYCLPGDISWYFPWSLLQIIAFNGNFNRGLYLQMYSERQEFRAASMTRLRTYREVLNNIPFTMLFHALG